jgi:DNA-binding Xre family transcriptional regulator
MAQKGMFQTSELVPLLAERGVHLSREQVYRLVTQPPQRLSMDTLAALCDILDVTPNDLIEVTAQARHIRKPAAGGGGVAPIARRTTIRACGRPPSGGARAGAADALLGAGLPGADIQRAGPRSAGPHQRRTPRLACQAGQAVRRLAGRAGAGLLAALGIPLSRHTALRILLRLPLPEVAVPRVLGVDDFALRRGQVYATILIDAQTGQRVDVLASRKADVLEGWLRSHPGVEVVCRDGSGAYGEAVRRALPGAVQAGDRWHLWHSLGEAVLKEVAAHSACWAAAGPPLNESWQARTTAERWRQVHDLTDRGTGLLECSRRLGLSLNTVKRYARAAEPERMIRAPRYRATLVDPYRDHLRARRAEDPAVPVHQLLAEIREQGYPGSMNLLYRYITQGRVEADRPHLSPRRVARMLLTRPRALTDSQQVLLGKLTAACPEMTSLANLVGDFAALLRPDPANEARLSDWARTARAADLPSVHAFARGLDLDAQAAIAAVTLPFHNGRTEGVNTKTKMIKRQMYGRAGFTLLRHRILLG